MTIRFEILGRALRPLALSSVIALVFAGCGADTAGLTTVTVDQLSDLLAGGDGVVACDANGADTREKYGVIPGALLLSHYKNYETAELPGDKTTRLVFYCASEACSAAPSAARKAVAQGWSNVSVLPSGIKGWVEAQKPVQKAPVS